MIISKNLIPNKEWILKNQNEKIGSVSKVKKGYNFLKKGKAIFLKDLEELGIEALPNQLSDKKLEVENSYSIYNFPCSSKPYGPVYNLKKKLPLFAKSSKSKSQYCAGFYIIKFRKNWVKSFCPKLITLERYSYYGPYKTEQEMKAILNTVNKNETTEFNTY